jgi:hypothetical protein
MERQAFTQACESLLLSADFIQLRETLEFSTPNIWHILGIPRREIRVSRFLAWLLDPQALHSFGDRFLRRLLIRALQTEDGRKSGLTPVEVLVIDFSSVRVATELRLGARRCDIAVFSSEERTKQGEGFICIIENKVDAQEGHDQTKDYYKTGLTVFPLEQYPLRIHIYLSPDGDPPQEENFIPLSYQVILEIIDKLKNEQQVTKTEHFLLQQFQENISRGIAMDTKTLDLAQAVYDQYHEVLEFIMQNVDRRIDDDSSTTKREWDGKSRFFNAGEKAGSGYRWEDYREYGFICAGGGKRYRNWMEQLQESDVIYAYVSGRGYVGIGQVVKSASPFREAKLKDGRRLTDLPLIGTYDDSEDDNMCDWIALVEWKDSVAKQHAVRQLPISRATTSRIYEDRKDVVQAVQAELQVKTNSA